MISWISIRITYEVVPNRKIVFNYFFPISLVAPKFEWLIEPEGPNSVFTTISYLRAGNFLRKLFLDILN